MASSSARVPTTAGVAGLVRQAIDTDERGLRTLITSLTPSTPGSGGGTAAPGALVGVVASGGTWAVPARPAGARFLWVPDGVSGWPSLTGGAQLGDLVVVGDRVEVITSGWAPPAALQPVDLPDGSRAVPLPGSERFDGAALAGAVLRDTQSSATETAFLAAFPEHLWLDAVRTSVRNICHLLFDRESDAPLRQPRVTFRFTDWDGIAHADATTGVIEFGARSRGAAVTMSYVTHELVHLYSRAIGYGTTAHVSGLAEGLADYVLVRLGYHPESFRPAGGGTAWDAGYDTTAFFLDWVERYASPPVPGFAKAMAAAIGRPGFTPAAIAAAAGGRSVAQLWSAYKAWCAALPGGGGTPPPSATLPFTDRQGVSFTGAGQTSDYHAWAAGATAGAKLLVWLHGDGAYEHTHPSSSYVFGGTSGIVAQARARGYIVVSARTPDRSGDITWWESGSSRAQYVAALIAHLAEGYAISRQSPVVLAGYSGGAQQLTQFTMASQWQPLAAWDAGALLLPIAGGEAPDTTPAYTATAKSRIRIHWTVGANDTAANSEDGFDARDAAEYGEQWFRGRGFTTSIQILPGLGHDLDGRFGGYVAAQLDRL